MQVKLTLQEILRDLRGSAKLTDISNATGISVATLSRFESDDRQDIPYQSLMLLAQHYNVSMDYLCGLTTNIQHRQTPIEELQISDEMVEILKGDKINNHFLEVLVTNECFSKLLASIEVYLNLATSKAVNQSKNAFDLAYNNLRNNIKQGDDVMEFLKDVTISHENYLRFHISERFNLMMTNMLTEYQNAIKNS